MQKRWTQKSADLDSLTNCIEEFFASRDFLTKKIEESPDERAVLLRPKFSTIRLEEPMNVRIAGNPDDFTVDLKASELTTRATRIGVLTKPVGGGYLLLRALKLKEELDRLEKEFWIYIEDKVAQLAGPARNLPKSSP